MEAWDSKYAFAGDGLIMQSASKISLVLEIYCSSTDTDVTFIRERCTGCGVPCAPCTKFQNLRFSMMQYLAKRLQVPCGNQVKNNWDTERLQGFNPIQKSPEPFSPRTCANVECA